MSYVNAIALWAGYWLLLVGAVMLLGVAKIAIGDWWREAATRRHAKAAPPPRVRWITYVDLDPETGALRFRRMSVEDFRREFPFSPALIHLADREDVLHRTRESTVDDLIRESGARLPREGSV